MATAYWGAEARHALALKEASRARHSFTQLYSALVRTKPKPSQARARSRIIGLDTNHLSVEGKAALRRQCATAPDLSLYL